MHLAFTTMNTPDDVRPDVLGPALEERGYEALFYGEHPQIPVRRRTPYPAGGEMPDMYTRMMDPFVSLTLAAAATRTLRLGTGVCLVLEHDPLVLAKTVATLDVISGGRVEFGVGVGWNVEELAVHRPGLAWSRRHRATAEVVAALRACWSDDEAAFDGEYVSFEPVWSRPGPLQRPHPPVLFGGAGRLGVAHTIDWADAWMPMDIALGDVGRAVGNFRRQAARAGRDIPITLVTFGDPPPDTLRRYRDLGIHRVVIGAARTGWDDPSTTLAYLDRYAPLVEELGSPP